MKAMTYKDYVGSAEVSVEDAVVHGKLRGIRDLVTYEADTPAGLRAAFEEAVDDYLADCAEEGRSPDKPYKGSLNVRIGEDLHRQFALEADARHLSLNELFVKKLHVANVVQDEVWPYASGMVTVDTESLNQAFKNLMTKIREIGPVEGAMGPAVRPKVGSATKGRRYTER